ncbi:MAG: histidine kinase [Rubrivivax sp. SCN 70-15]|nr:MAG: histidine kinase [Rubrivivax sp. SCN 70-15]
MDPSSADLGTYGYALAAIAYGAFAVHQVRTGVSGRQRLQALFIACSVATVGWAVAALLDPLSRNTAPAYTALALDLLRYALWYAFLLGLLRPRLEHSDRQSPRFLIPTTVAVLAVSAAALVYRIATGHYEQDGTRTLLSISLSLPLFGLLLVEQLFRNVGEDSRWNAKPLCIGLATIFVFDLYLYAEGALFGRLDPDALTIRGAVHALAVPFLFVTSRRRKDWIRRLQVSRSAAFYSTTLLLVGSYLLFMSAVGYYVRYFGGDWGRGLQLGLLSAGLVVRGLANMVESPGGSLWTREGDGGDYRQSTRWNQPAAEAREPAGSSFVAFLGGEGWVIDVDEFRHAPRRYAPMSLPTWVLASPDLWLVVPLLVGEAEGSELLGFVTLVRPRAPLELNWEVRDLLKTASRQAAGFLAQMHATEALLEARKFEAFNRMSAFVVHDLKNIVTQLSLMMKNAQRLHANPEFQQDMLLTVESSLEKMRRLMLQLREGATPPGGLHGVELAPVLRRLAGLGHARGRAIEVECAEGLATRGLEDRLERVLGHLVHNALDATPADGRVWLRGSRHSGQVKVEVGDTGVGMSEEFVQSKLFRPFSTTKPQGMGIGLYESVQYIREIGGAIDVASQPGQGTVVTVLMPSFDMRAGSDLLAPART